MKLVNFQLIFATCLAIPLLVGCDKASPQTSIATSSGEIKIGFVVKQPEEPWFQLEWKFAKQAGDEKGFQVITVGAPDGERALAALDTLAAQGAQGAVICTPDVHLGPALLAKAKSVNLKLLTVDDQFLDADGKPMGGVPHVGISARNIGKLVGESLVAQMTARGWSKADVGVCAVTFDELDTARERTGGALGAISGAGIATDRVYKAAQRTSDVTGAFDATNNVLTQHADVKHWLICGMNDSAVMGAVRAMEGRGLTADQAIGIGINGTDCIAEFQKPAATSFWGSILLTPKRHGYDTATMVFEWVKDGKTPPPITYTSGLLITRDTYQAVMKEQGL